MTTLRYVTKRDGSKEPFDPLKIKRAIRKAVLAVKGSHRPSATATLFTMEVVGKLKHRFSSQDAPHVETIQDVVGDVLHHDLARGTGSISSRPESLWMAYMLYREGHRLVRNGDLEPDNFYPDTRPIDKINALRGWNREMGCDTVKGLNDWALRRDMRELIVAAERRSDEELIQVVEKLDSALKEGRLKAILMTGPSSSGKTVTTRRAVHLLSKLHRGIKFVPMEVDMYFRDNRYSETLYYDVDGKRVKDVNFELPETYDIPLFNEHLAALLRGESIMVPRYNFSSGRREGESHPLSLGENEVLLIDCMHALFPALTEAIPAEMKTKVFIEPLSVLS
ncbi:MAG: ATP cone domain-containing protein, partial [Candidatus Micrarchaeota archaeon]